MKRKAKNKKDPSVIPVGPYCYSPAPGVNSYGIPNVKYCPYLSTKEYNGVHCPYCEYMELGGLGEGTTDKEFDRLMAYFGNEDKVFEGLPLSLLFDSCKECGENQGDDLYD